MFLVVPFLWLCHVLILSGMFYNVDLCLFWIDGVKERVYFLLMDEAVLLLIVWYSMKRMKKFVVDRPAFAILA